MKAELATFADRSTVLFVRTLQAPIERVWAYLTEPDYLAKWLMGGVIAQSVGGDVRLELGATGRVTAFEPPHLLEYTWNEEDASVGPVVNSLVRWELAREGAATRLTLTHTRLPEVELVGHGAGWDTFLQRLAAALDDRELEEFYDLYARIKPQYIAAAQAAGIAM